MGLGSGVFDRKFKEISIMTENTGVLVIDFSSLKNVNFQYAFCHHSEKFKWQIRCQDCCLATMPGAGDSDFHWVILNCVYHLFPT